MNVLPNDPVIVSAFRTPLGRYGGSLSSVRPDDMVASLLADAGHRFFGQKDDIDEVIVGCANQAGEDNRNVARMAVLLANLKESIPAITVNRLCASGLDAVIDGARRIITNEAKFVVTGGVESMSRAPYVLAKQAVGYKLGAPEIFDTSLGWRFFNEAMRKRTPPEHNGVTAERLVAQLGISRQRQDEFALRSHQRAIESQDNGFFGKEIVPQAGQAKTAAICLDEGPRRDTTLEKLTSLKPAFVDGGTVTAGNSSTLNDGAAMVVLMAHDFAKAHSIPPLARVVGFASAGVDPLVMGIGPVFATEKLLKRCRLSINDFSAIEINEAFAAQVLSVIDLLKIDESRVNQRGGAIALGHPLGCSGARIVTTLINHLRHTGGGLGLASLCVGVGQGVSMAVEVFC